MPASLAKPADVGTGVVCASFGRDGSWLSVGCLHPRWGFVELNGLPAFDERSRGDPDATRNYRLSMTDPRHAWLRVEGVDGGSEVELIGVPGTRRIEQHWRFGDGVARVLRIAGRLDRPALAEITEVNPPAPTGAVTRLSAEGRRLVIRATELPAVATVDVSDGLWAVVDGGAELRIGPECGSLEIAVTLAPDDEVAEQPSALRPAPAQREREPSPHGIEAIVARALMYVRSCTALAFRPDERAILTDHRILPLSWTRDAYYQALLLLATGLGADRDIVADHLRWLWRRCERPGGSWMRSHHGNGAPKDLVFQADQQLYPLVELADFWRATGTLPDGVDWARTVSNAWRSILAVIDPATGLIGTDEGAADDPADAPYIAASQVLLWYAAVRLAEPGLASHIGLPSEDLLATAAAVRGAFDRHVVIDGRWAYAVDGQGRSVDYHDANDLPIALAPLWGFCRSDDPAWQATIAIGFSPANPGFVDGQPRGLGSRHTPGAWPLGHVQAWLVGRLLRDEAAAAESLDELKQAAFTDGMLPEALTRDGGTTTAIRHWFAWPGAALGAFWLLDQRGDMGVLAARRPDGDTGSNLA